MPNTREKELWRLVNKAFQNSIEKFGDIFAKDVTRDLLANGVTVQQWISVKDRLPEKHGGVYVCLLKFPGSKQAFPYCLTWHAYGDNGYVNGPHFSDEGLDGLKVTHWMPLPQLPKGE